MLLISQIKIVFGICEKCLKKAKHLKEWAGFSTFLLNKAGAKLQAQNQGIKVSE